MSRYQIAVEPAVLRTHPGAYVVVGWDNPMGTFFAQVLAPWRDEGYEPVEWIGLTPHEITSVIDLCANLKPWADIPAEIAGCLAHDLATATPPTALQQVVHDLF